jgi:hypothetical protein
MGIRVQVSWNLNFLFIQANPMVLPLRSGKDDRLFPWGNNWTPRGEYFANIWTGEFPSANDVGCWQRFYLEIEFIS